MEKENEKIKEVEMESKQNMFMFLSQKLQTPTKSGLKMCLTCEWCPKQFSNSKELVRYFKKIKKDDLFLKYDHSVEAIFKKPNSTEVSGAENEPGEFEREKVPTKEVKDENDDKEV